MMRECTRLASAITKARANGQCQACAPARYHCGTDAAHIWAKSTYPGAEFELDNLVWLARSCHEFMGSARLVGPCEMRDLAVTLRGRKRVEDLRMLGLGKGRPVQEQLESLRAEAKRMGIA